jgi:hypothetical protein
MEPKQLDRDDRRVLRAALQSGEATTTRSRARRLAKLGLVCVEGTHERRAWGKTLATLTVVSLTSDGETLARELVAALKDPS